MAENYTFDLARMTPEARAVWLDVYSLGFGDGIEAGRRQLEDEWRGTHEVSAAIARQVAKAGPWDELADRRRDHGRAEAQRRILAERGII